MLSTLRDESDLVRSGRFAVLSSTTDDEACAMAVMFGERDDAVDPDVESKGFKRFRRPQCEGGSRNATVQSIRASRRVVLLPQSPDGTPHSIHNLASESVLDLVMVEPSRAGAAVLSGRWS